METVLNPRSTRRVSEPDTPRFFTTCRKCGKRFDFLKCEVGSRKDKSPWFKCPRCGFIH